MSEEEKEYRKWHTPEDYDRRVALLRLSIANAKKADAKKRALTAKNAWWLRRKAVISDYGV